MSKLIADLEAAQKEYRAAYAAHQRAGASEFATTLQGWRDAWAKLESIEKRITDARLEAEWRSIFA